MSLGHKQVLEAKNIVVVITGANKRELAKDLLSRDSFGPEFPLSIIHHPKVRKKTEILLTKEVTE